MTATVECHRRRLSTWTKCQCDECRPEQLRIDKLRKHRGDSADWKAIRDRAAEILGQLIADGWSPMAISDAYDLPLDWVRRSVPVWQAGGTRRPGRRLSWRIVTGPTRRPRIGNVPSKPTTRRLQALAVRGWSTASLQVETGLAKTVLREATRGARPQVTARVAEAVREAYKRLQETPGGCPVTAARAAQMGWAPPAAWDDIDDPRARPVGVLPPPQRRTVEALTTVARRLAAGDDLSTVAADMGVTPRALDERAYRYWVRTGDRTALDLIRADGVPK